MAIHWHEEQQGMGPIPASAIGLTRPLTPLEVMVKRTAAHDGPVPNRLPSYITKQSFHVFVRLVKGSRTA